MMAAQSGDALARPAVATPSGDSISVEHSRDEIIGADSSQGSYRIEDFGWRVGGVLATPTPGQAQFGVNPTFPMNDEDDLARLRIDVDDHLVNQGAHDALLQSRVGVRVLPHRFQICGKLFE